MKLLTLVRNSSFLKNDETLYSLEK